MVFAWDSATFAQLFKGIRGRPSVADTARLRLLQQKDFNLKGPALIDLHHVKWGKSTACVPESAQGR